MIIHQINGYIETLYLVEYPHQLLLLDSGCRSDVARVQTFIDKNLNRKMSDLKLVLISHAHPDHSGGAAFYQSEFGIKIAASPNINKWYSGLSGFFTYWIDIALTYLVAKKKNQKFENILFPRKIKFDFELAFDQYISGFEDWKVLSTPGHTDYDLSFYHSVGSIAYIADNMIKSKTKYFRPYPLFSPEKYKKSLKRYVDLGIEHFLLAHDGKCRISKDEILKLIDTTPTKPRRHTTSLHRILLQVLMVRSKKK